ncbi:hypothetical protein OEA41_007267 [Lepraria neglecta]|uniref:DUF6604 domain-containing protein n=1 Tax=Lepraria neglecta TaxID=209136 RepID=A0AAD9ZFI2_9LECA|nr:hypothetical protein OEA41_007267 [Lepraria neglecta]
MLGCTHHLTKEGQIPSGLHSTYVQYKQDTRAVVAWLLSHGTSDYKCRTTLSISDLVGLAEIIQRKAVEMPDTIDFLFREAIKARTQLSNFFRRTSSKGKNDEETLNHEHFTFSLTKIHANLCECCAKPKEKRKQADQCHPCEDSKKAPSNPFSILKFGCTVDHEYPSGIRTHDSQYDNSASDREGKTATSGPSAPRLIDDTLVEAIELRKAAQEMVDLLSATRNAWEQASMGKFSIVIAAFMTNAAFAAFKPVEQQLKLSCDVSDPGIFQSKLNQVEPCSGELPAGSQTQSSMPEAQLVEALQHSWRLLLGLKAHDTVKQPVQSAVPPQPFSQITIRQGVRSASKNKESLNVILQNIRQHIQNDSFCPNIVRADVHPGISKPATLAHTAKATAGFGSRNDVDDPGFQYGKLSLLHHVKGKGYHLDRVTWERVYNVENNHTNEAQPSQKSTKRCPCSQNTRTVHDLYSGTSQQSLKSLQTAILAEFTGPFPIPKINFFEVYLSCLNIISIISDKYHGDKARPGQHCLCFVDPILSFADRCGGNGRASLLLGCRELVDICRQAMVEVLGGKELQGFLWEGI